MEKSDKYKNYKIEDFVWDDKFREWVFTSNPELTLFWTNWLINNPDNKTIVFSAKEIILGLKVSEFFLANHELSDSIQVVMNSIKEKNKIDKK